MRLSPKMSMAVAGGLTVLTAGAIWLAMDAFDHHQAADRVLNAVWVATPSGDRVAIHEALFRSSDNGSWVVDRVALLDPHAGDVVDTWIVPSDAEESAVLRGTRAGTLWFRWGDVWHPRYQGFPAEGGTPVTLESALGGVPGVVLPLYQVEVREDGLVYVEGDDKRRWTVDLATRTATPWGDQDTSPTWSGAPFVGCSVSGWEVDGRTLEFVDTGAERHSQADHWGLAPVADPPAEPAQITISFGTVAPAAAPGPAPIAGGFTNPGFLCGETGGTRLSGDRWAFVHEEGPARVSRIDRSGARGWTWTVPEPEVEVWEAWPVDGGLVVRTDRRFTSLGADGSVRWTVRR